MRQPKAHTPGASKDARRSTWAGALAVVVVAALLAACSVIPPQSVTDPLGLDSELLALQFVGPTAAAQVGPQAVTGAIATSFEFEDWDADIPVTPGTLTNDVSIKAASLSPVTEAEAPAEITLSDPVLTLRVWQGAATWDDADAGDRVEYVLESASSITLVRGTCVITGSRCPYAYQGGDAAFGSIKLSGTPLQNLFNIATSEPTPNSGSVSLTVQGEPDSLAGKTLTITLSAAEGTMGF